MVGSSHRRRVQVVLCAGFLLVGCSSAGSGALGDGSVRAIEVAAVVGGDGAPLDAVPSPDGSTSYFTVGDPPRIFRTSDDPGRPVPLDVGTGFTSVRGLSVSLDGSHLFVADAGSVVSLPASGGQPAPVAGTEGTEPRGVEVARQDGGEVVYFSGRDPADGVPGVFKVPAAGGARTVVAKGAPLVAPDGVAVGRSGAVFVSDHGRAVGSVYRLDPGGPVWLAEMVDLGDPGGVAVTADESTLLVSSRDPSRGRARVLLVDLDTRDVGVVDKVIGENEHAGGLHRAHDVDVFAWADVSRSGRVYRVEL